MCGIFGVAYPNALGYNQKKFIEQATFVGTLRGVDSTGLALVDKDNNVEIHKRALAGPDFATSRVGERAFSDLDKSFVVIGHNRAATRGIVKDYTAHPFGFGSITGCHNGTLEPYNNGVGVHKHPVDSMNLLDAISRIGPSPDAKQVADFLSGVKGSFALNWYDSETENLWFARNDERPISYFMDGKGLYWASEGGMLGWLGFRNNVLKKLADLHIMPSLTAKAFNTRDMEFVEEAKFTVPKSVSTVVYGGCYSGNTGYGEPIYFYDKELKMRVARIDIKDAIRKKLWTKEDEEVFLIFDEGQQPRGPKDSPTTGGYTGTAYLQAGEYVPFRCYPKQGDVDCEQVYTGRVAAILVSEKSRQIIPQITVHSSSFQPVSGDQAAIAAQIEESACWDMSTPLEGGNSTFREGDGDQGETTTTEEAVKEGEKVVPINGNKKEDAQSGELFRGPSGGLVTGQVFDGLVAEGCDSCGGIITREDADKVGWILGRKKRPLCEDCISVIKSDAPGYGLKDSMLS